MLTKLARHRRAAALALVLIGSTALASCATPTPYQPATGSGYARDGYSDEQIEPNRSYPRISVS